MRQTFFLAFALALFFTGTSGQARDKDLPVYNHPDLHDHEGWRLGIQLYSFNKNTFMEALDKAESLGLSWVEAYPGQVFSKEKADLRFDHNLPEELRAEVLKILNQKQLKLVNYGVVGLPNDETASRRVFDFAKSMGIETIVSEPEDDAWDLVDRLCQEYQIKVAIHNHPDPSRYWHPDTVLNACMERSKYIGACADIGHWMRSGVDPLEAIRKLKNRLISFHFGDLNQFDVREAHDVPWGTGAAETDVLLKALYEQGFEGVFSIEYEYNVEASLPELEQSIAYFNKVVYDLNAAQWKPLFTDDLSNAIFESGSWTLQDGILSPGGDGDIWTDRRYDNFILDLEFKLAENTNSGIFIRTGDIKEWLHTAIEVQILDSYGKEKPDREDCGAIFDCLKPQRNMVKKPGEWNRYTITCKGNKIYVVLNGKQVIDMDLNYWAIPHRNPDGSQNKFNTAYKDMPREGYIGFQYHGHPVWFRNIQIRELEKSL